jgi:hypothetical protein
MQSTTVAALSITHSCRMCVCVCVLSADAMKKQKADEASRVLQLEKIIHDLRQQLRSGETDTHTHTHTLHQCNVHVTLLHYMFLLPIHEYIPSRVIYNIT